MKLCPQCEFIYEDDQSLCDMDGKELVSDAGTLAFEETVPSTFAQPQQLAETRVSLPSELSSNLLPVLLDSPPSREQSRSFAIAGAVGVVLVALLFLVYYARTQAAAPAASVAASHKQSSSASSNLMPPSASFRRQSLLADRVLLMFLSPLGLLPRTAIQRSSGLRMARLSKLTRFGREKKESGIGKPVW